MIQTQLNSISRIEPCSRSRQTLDRDNASPISGETGYDKARVLAQSGDYESAIKLLQDSRRTTETRDLLGVCLMRSGKLAEAVQVYRQLVLIPGSVMERPEIIDSCKRNFATALLMAGLPSGTLDVLSATADKNHPVAIHLRDCIKRWETTLSFFRRLDWKTGRIEPKNCVVPIDFEPGEITASVVTSESKTETPQPPVLAA